MDQQRSVPAHPGMTPIPPAGAQTAPQTRAIPFKFTGTAKEYFRIWIVNLALTVLTFGIFSAWAKVRRKQYFYRHTFLDHATFEYLADPLAILKGRIIIAAFLGLVTFSQYVSVGLYAALVVLLIFATPWVLVRALSFNARYSAYRNVRFSFHGTTGESYKTYLIATLAYVLTLGLGFPYMQWRISRFVVDGHRYGNLGFRFRSTQGDYFKVFFIAFGMTIAFFMVVGMIGVAVVMLTSFAAGSPDVDPGEISPLIYPIILSVYAFFIVPTAYIKANVANLFWGGMDVGPHRLESTQTFKGVLALLVTNLLGVVFTLGLATPWAVIRSLRYRVEHLKIHADGPLLVHADHDQEKPGPFGDAATDLGDFDFDFG